VEKWATWENARTCCIDNAGSLAEAINEEELTALKHEMGNYHAFWIGGTDKVNDGIWKWDQSGLDIDITWFDQDGPDHGGTNENCLLYFNQLFLDDRCQDVFYFVCQDRVTPTPTTTTPITITTPTATTQIATTPDAATQDPCINKVCGSGTCVNGRCNYCQPDPCEAGTCLPHPSVGNFSFTCQCRDGYTGPTCKILNDDPCRYDPAAVCKNGGTCEVQIRPGPNDWICRCSGKPEIGQAKDCSVGKSSKYPIPEKVMIAIVTIPFYLLGIALAVFCVYECVQTGELPDLDWASDSTSSDSSSEDDELPVAQIIPRDTCVTSTEQATVVVDYTEINEKKNELIDSKDVTQASGSSSSGLNKSTSEERGLTENPEAFQDVAGIEEFGSSVNHLNKARKHVKEANRSRVLIFNDERTILSFVSFMRHPRGRSLHDSIKSRTTMRSRPKTKETNKPISTSKSESSASGSSLNKATKQASESSD